MKMGLGVYEIGVPYGMTVKTYDAGRILCDCLRNIDKLDRDVVITALKRYAKSQNRNSAKMLEYSAAIKIQDKVYRYLEVLE